jgi:hypothetical protein
MEGKEAGMKRITSFLGGAALIGLLLLLPVPASAVIWDFDIQLGGTLESITSWGTIELTDNGDSVDIEFNLTNPSDPTDVLKIGLFVLNYDDAKFSNSTDFSVLGFDVLVDENDVQADGYTDGFFDLQIPDVGTLNDFEPFTIYQLSALGFNLSPDDFAFLDTSGELFAALHIQGIDAGPFANGGDGSLWVGATGGGPPPIPEPSTLLLLGGGLLGLALYGRKRMNG